jgi:hypothetical protein
MESVDGDFKGSCRCLRRDQVPRSPSGDEGCVVVLVVGWVSRVKSREGLDGVDTSDSIFRRERSVSDAEGAVDGRVNLRARL